MAVFSFSVRALRSFLQVRSERNVPDFVTYVVYDPHSFALCFLDHLYTSYKRRSDAKWFLMSLINNDDEIPWRDTFVGIDDARAHHICPVTYEPNGAHINAYKVPLWVEFNRASHSEKGRFFDTEGYWHSV
jgi:hypothetical protein